LHRPETEEAHVGALHTAEFYDNVRYLKSWVVAYDKALRRATKKRPGRRRR
jgi:hypothetical protein